MTARSRNSIMAVAAFVFVAAMLLVGVGRAQDRIFKLEIKNEFAWRTKVTVGNKGFYCVDLPTRGTTWTIEPGKSVTVEQVARTQGHGCDGKQGAFQMDLLFLTERTNIDPQSQGFEMDNRGNLGKTGSQLNYKSTLDRKPEGGWIWTISGPLVAK